MSPLLGAIAAVLAAGLAAAGLFFPLHILSNTIGDDEAFAYDLTWWGTDAKADTLGDIVANSTPAGLTIIAAAVLLVLGAVFVFLSGKSVRPGVRTAGRSLVSAGTAMLAGVAALQLIYSLSDMANWNEDTLEPGESITFRIDLGLYLPFGGVLLAIVATVLAHRGLRAARREPATPPMGMRMPRQYGGPGPMTGQQPAVPGPGQSSGRFAPVPRPGVDPGVGQGSGQFAPVPGPQSPVSQPPAPVSQAPVSQAPAETSLVSRLDGSDDESTPDSGTDSEPDPDITQRTTVHTGPPETQPEASTGPAVTTPPPASSQQGGPSTAQRAPEQAASMWAPGPSAHTTSAPEAPAHATPAPEAAPAPSRPEASTSEPAAPTSASEAPANAAPERGTPAPGTPAPEPSARPAATSAPASPEPSPAAEPGRPAPEPPAPSTQGEPTPPSTAESKPAEPGPLNLPPAPPAPELADEKNNRPD